MNGGLRDSLTTDNAEPLNLRSGVRQTAVAKRSKLLATAIAENATDLTGKMPALVPKWHRVHKPRN